MDITSIFDYLAYLAEKKSIDAVCALSPNDRATLEAARMYELRDKPMASRFLDYYLNGSGKNMEVRTQQLLEQDSGVRAKAYTEVSEKMKAGVKRGVIALPQPVFKNQDWRNATGSLNLEWEQTSGQTIRFSFTNKYRWHPKEARVTQCVHQAADNLKNAGAKDFLMVGKPVDIPVSQIQKEIAATPVLTQSSRK